MGFASSGNHVFRWAAAVLASDTHTPRLQTIVYMGLYWDVDHGLFGRHHSQVAIESNV